MKRANLKNNLVVFALGLIPVIWLGLLIAPALAGGLPEILQNLTAALDNPLHIEWCGDSLKTVPAFIAAYGFGIGIYYATKRNTRPRQEHGSAKWGDTAAVCRKYRDGRFENPAEHMNFATNIQWWITGAISRNRMLRQNPMSFPVNLLDRLFNIKNEMDKHFCEHCPQNDSNSCSHLINTLAQKYELSTEETARSIHYLTSWKSLEQMNENDEDISDYGLFIDELDDFISKAHYARILIELLNTIKPREKEVLLYRNGFTEKGVLTLEEIRQIFGVTRERIRQLEEKALRRM